MLLAGASGSTESSQGMQWDLTLFVCELGGAGVQSRSVMGANPVRKPSITYGLPSDLPRVQLRGIWPEPAIRLSQREVRAPSRSGPC